MWMYRLDYIENWKFGHVSTTDRFKNMKNCDSINMVQLSTWNFNQNKCHIVAQELERFINVIVRMSVFSIALYLSFTDFSHS